MKNKGFYVFSLFLMILIINANYGYCYKVCETSYGAWIKWFSNDAFFHVNSSSAPDGFIEASLNAMGTWTESGSEFSFSYGGTTLSDFDSGMDGYSTITYGYLSETEYENTVGLNRFWFYVSSGELIESDIILNSRFAWGGASGFDVESVILHELGHALCLEDLYSTSDSDKVMYGYTDRGEVKRNLHYDDINGIVAIYGGEANPDVPPVISSIPDSSGIKGVPWESTAPQLISGTPPVIWSLFRGPDGMIINSTTGTVSWGSPVEGEHIITIKAQNNAGYDEASWLLTVLAPPVIADIEDITIKDETQFTSPSPRLISGTQPVTWSLEKSPSGMTINNATGVVSWNNPVEGEYVITITAENDVGYDNMSWLLCVVSLPVISEIEDVTIEAGIPWTGPAPELVSGTTPVTWSLVKAPDAMVIVASTGIVSWKDPLEGVYLVSLKAENSAGSTNTSFLLTVEADQGQCAASYLLGEKDSRLNTLRRFRDEKLLTNRTGIKIIGIYYDKSPDIIRICDKHHFLKQVFKSILGAVTGILCCHSG